MYIHRKSYRYRFGSSGATVMGLRPACSRINKTDYTHRNSKEATVGPVKSC